MDFTAQFIQEPVCGPISMLGRTTDFGLLFREAGNGFPALSQSWSTANMALYVPFYVNDIGLVVEQFSVQNGGTISGNFDIGIYDAVTLAKIISTGSTAQAGTNAVQFVNVADTPIGPPGWYLLAMACDNTTAQFPMPSIDGINLAAAGVSIQTSAFPLPSTATPATPSNGTSYKIPTATANVYPTT